MRYLKSQQQRSQMPEINLIPMMDVIMTILTFFIIVAMTLTGIQSVDLSLPDVKNPEEENAQNLSEPLVVELSRSQQLIVDGKPASEQQVSDGIRQYLLQNPRGAVLLKADQRLSYQKVVEMLTRLKQVGGSRVSLAVEPV